jgi:hypothetical protein
MNRIALVFVFFACTILLPKLAIGQSKKADLPLSSYIPTENVDPRKESNKRKNRPETSEYSFIYKRHNSGLLLGNACVIQATHKMGFEYVLQPVGYPNGISKFRFGVNNVWVNTKLVFTRSPFWKVILDNKIKDCRQKSGDFAG